MASAMINELEEERSGHQDGWVMTENLGGMLFYLIMLGIIASLLYMIFSGSKLSVTQQSVTSMALQTQGLYAGSSTYEGLNNTIAIKSGLVPKKFLKGNVIRTPWGGTVNIEPGADTSTFVITMQGIPQEECTKLAVYQLDMWVDVSVNGSEINKEQGVSSASSACNGNNNTIAYTVR